VQKEDTPKQKGLPAFGYIMRVEPDGSMSAEWVSDSYTGVTGYTIDDLARADVRDRMVPSEDHHIAEQGLAALHRGEEWAGDHRLITKSGEVKWIRFFSHPVMEDGRLIRFEGSGHDVTELREVKSEFSTTDEALKLLDEAVWPIIWTTDRDLIITTSTGAGLQLYGLSPGELVGRHLFSTTGSEDPDYTPNASSLRALEGEGSAYEMEWRGHVFRTLIEPLREDGGEIIGTAGVTVPKDLIAADLRTTLSRGLLVHMETGDNGMAAATLDVIEIEDLKIDPIAFAAWKGDDRLQLSPTEFRLLRQLASKPNEALSREDLLRDVWHHEFMGDSRLVDMAINRLRSKIEDDPHDPTLIRTVRGVGYLFQTAG
jgi:PAS domain S-box-containing protein